MNEGSEPAEGIWFVLGRRLTPESHAARVAMPGERPVRILHRGGPHLPAATRPTQLTPRPKLRAPSSATRLTLRPAPRAARLPVGRRVRYLSVSEPCS